MAAQVRPSIAAAVSNFKLIRQVAALSRANRGFLVPFCHLITEVARSVDRRHMFDPDLQNSVEKFGSASRKIWGTKHQNFADFAT